MKKFDVVIIGSGLSGLICANILGKEGYSVCVLEKSNQIGGCLQSFQRQGIEFDTGVHYIGSLGEGEYLYNFFKFLGIMDKVKFKKMDEQCFDKIYLNDKEYSYAMGFERFADTLTREFPKEKVSINNYVKELKRKVELINILYLRDINTNNIIEPILTDTSLKAFLDSITSNYQLQNVLSATNSLYAGLPDRTSAHIHTIINHSYIQSSWRPVGGSNSITDALVTGIEGAGGVVLNNKKAFKFHYKDSLIESIELTNGEQYFAKNFISSIHPSEMLKLVEPAIFRKSYYNRISQLKNTISTFSIYINLKADSFDFMNCNSYCFRDDNVWSVYNYTEKSWPDAFMLMTPPLTDNDKYAKSMIVLSFMKYNDVSQWENTKIEKRGDEYKEFKRKKADILLNAVEERFPGIRSCIKEYYTSSPLTYRDYTGTKHGAIYGIERDCRQPFSTFIPPRTKIPNLLLTGQNITLHGVLGVTIGSVITCGELIGLNYLIKKIRDNC